MTSETHITTRRGFIAAMGFGGVSLYGLWAAYGAAPGPMALLGLGGGHDAHDAGASGGHGGHGAAADGPTPDEFNRMTAEFIERYRLPDGTVHPRLLAQPAQDVTGHREHGDDHAALGHGAMDSAPMDHGQVHAAPNHGDAGHAVAQGLTHGDDTHAGDGTLDVYLVAGIWYYLPGKLRLDAGRPYRFKLMAVDLTHGASIQFGRGGRIVRLRPGRMTEVEMIFHEPGNYLVYCTVYCGPAHDIMQASLEVV